MNQRILILGAFEPELKPARERLAAYNNVEFHTVGIGSARAAAQTAKLLATISGEDPWLLFIGSVGSVDPEVEIFSPVIASSALYADSALISEDAYLPESFKRSYESNSQLSAQLSAELTEECLKEPVYCPPAVTRSAELAQKLQQHTGARFENLELFGIAEAAAAFNVPWSSLCLATNTVAPEGREQWLAHHEEAAERSAALLERIFRGLKNPQL